jgi:hypothetical protein
MELRGKVIAVMPMVSGQGKNGEWKRQEYVIEHSFDSQYPRRMAFNLWGENVNRYQLQIGQMIKLDFDIDCREYQGRWFNDIRAWRVEIEDAGQSATAPQGMPQAQVEPQTPFVQSAAATFNAAEAPAASGDDSDLPF